ncbi:hypothetical protein I7X43_05885 [Inhella sp. 4Y17]|uniref:Uncharacterized protein n=1 Tax=Inhella gelatinilytica TaxID=2795030 RepID=A0A931ND99_9BURK|nr:hypothetical protein [Inhella gelatinilytica]
MRIALVLGLLWILWTLWRKMSPRPPSPPSTATRASSPEAMSRCAECGVHLPESQALPGRGGVFCCAEHRERFESRQP